MAGIDNNTLLYLRGDSFNDLSVSNKQLNSNNNKIIEDNIFGKCLEISNYTTNTIQLFNSLTLSADFTLCAFVKSSSFYSTTMGSYIMTASNNYYFGVKSSNSTLIFASHNGSTILNPSNTLSANEWHHIAMTRKDNVLRIFLDGKKIGETTFSNTISMTDCGLHSAKNVILNLCHLVYSNVCLWDEDFTPPIKPFNSIAINITNQTRDKIDFNISKLGQEVVNKIEVLVNGQVSKTYTSIGDLTYNIDKSLLFNGNNKIKIKVTFDNDYSEEKEIDYEYVINNLPTSSSLKELIDRQELLTNAIEVQKNILKSILESKNVDVSDSENKLSILIDKVNELESNKFWLYKDGEEYVSIINHVQNNNITTSQYSLKKEADYLYLKAISNSGSVGFGAQNKINTSGYSKVKIEYSCSNFNNSEMTLMLLNSFPMNSTGSNRVATYLCNATGNKLIFESDITTINTEVFITFNISLKNVVFDCKIHKVWLER